MARWRFKIFNGRGTTAKIWSARTSPRFETTRHVASSESGDVSPHSKSWRWQKLKFLLCSLRFFAAILFWSQSDGGN
jgi:hypothetical protein